MDNLVNPLAYQRLLDQWNHQTRVPEQSPPQKTHMANHAFVQRLVPQSLDRRLRRRHQQHAQLVGDLIQGTYRAEQPQIDQTGHHAIDRLESKSHAKTDHPRV